MLQLVGAPAKIVLLAASCVVASTFALCYTSGHVGSPPADVKSHYQRMMLDWYLMIGAIIFVLTVGYSANSVGRDTVLSIIVVTGMQFLYTLHLRCRQSNIHSAAQKLRGSATCLLIAQASIITWQLTKSADPAGFVESHTEDLLQIFTLVSISRFTTGYVFGTMSPPQLWSKMVHILFILCCTVLPAVWALLLGLCGARSWLHAVLGAICAPFACGYGVAYLQELIFLRILAGVYMITEIKDRRITQVEAEKERLNLERKMLEAQVRRSSLLGATRTGSPDGVDSLPENSHFSSVDESPRLATLLAGSPYLDYRNSRFAIIE